MLDVVRKRIEEDRLLLPGEKVVIGVSGGVDSTALMHILWKLNKEYAYGWEIHVVHLNHSFRGDESDADASYVQNLCHTLGVKCHLFQRDISSYMKESRLGAQEASRLVRYQLFEQVADHTGATKVVLAHHADDQVETILFRLIRGTSLQGIGGIPSRRWLVPDQIEVVRPLLTIPKSSLEAYCQQEGIHPREDSSNQSRKYIRNRIRLDVIPLLTSINVKAREHILHLSELAQADDRYLYEVSQQRLDEVAHKPNKDQIIICRKKFQSCDLALQRRMITLILRYLSSGIEWSSQHVEAVLHVIHNDNPSASISLSKKIFVHRVYQDVHFVRSEPKEVVDFFAYEVIVPGTTRIFEYGLALHTTWLAAPPQWDELPANAAVFDGDSLPGTLSIRNRLPGDRMAPLGVEGTKKLKDVFIDAKLPKVWRDKYPIVVAGSEILWVPGVRRSALAQVTEHTTSFLYMELEFGEEWQEVHHA